MLASAAEVYTLREIFAGGVSNVGTASRVGAGLVSKAAKREKTGQVRPGRVRNRAIREESLVAAAGRLFASRGYEATTTRQIASEAGCAEGLIHRYFQGKEGLLLALIRSRTSR